MAVTVRLGKAEVALIVGFIGERTDATSRGLVDKLDKADLMRGAKKSRTGLPPMEAIRMFRSVLGERLVVPANPGPPFWGAMARGLSSSGWTLDDCAAIAQVARREWKGFVKAESLVRQGDVLLASAQRSLPFERETVSAPQALGKDEL